MASDGISVIALSVCPAAGLTWRRPSGAWTLTVVCRATFVLEPGCARLAPVQHLPIAGDRGYPDGSRSGLYAPTDLVPMKPRADVLVAGSPRPVPGGDARLVVGAIDKRIQAAAAMGAGGFGPVAASAPPRVALLGSAAGARADDAWHGRVLPDDLDPGFFNAAPPDQQLLVLRDDERIVLENLHPEHAELSTRLPGLRPLALVERPGSAPRRLSMRADTLWIDASRGIGAVVWRGQMALARGPALRVLVDLELPEEPRPAPPRQSIFQQTVGLAPVLPGERAFGQVTLPFLGDGAPLPARGPSAGGGLPFRQVESTGVSPWARGRIGARPESPGMPAATESASPPEMVAMAPRPPPATLQFVWFDPASPPRVRREPTFRAILDAMDGQPLDPEIDFPPDAQDLADREDRRDLFEILARGDATDDDGAARALERSAREDWRLVQPIVLLAGDLALLFDALETLKATISAAARVAGADLQARRLMVQAQAFLAAPGAVHGSAIAAGLAARIRAAAVAAGPEKQRQLVAGDLDAEVTRGLLDARAVQRRRLLGAPHVRALFAASTSPGGTALPVYLEEALARALPRAERLRVRMLATVYPALDADETGAVALRPLALAIVTPPMPVA